MDIKSLFADHKNIQNGVWVKDIPDFGEVHLKVRGLRSPQYREALDRANRAVPRNKRDVDGTPFLSERHRIAAQLMYEVVLLDWRGLTHEGVEVPYTRDLAKEWCTNPDYAQFADAVAYSAQLVDRGYAEELAEVVGNSKSESAGS